MCIQLLYSSSRGEELPRQAQQLKNVSFFVSLIVTELQKRRASERFRFSMGEKVEYMLKWPFFFCFSSLFFPFQIRVIFTCFHSLYIGKSFHKSFYSFCAVVVLRYTTTQIGRGSSCCCHDSFTLFCGFALIIQMRCRHGVRRFLNIGRKRRN